MEEINRTEDTSKGSKNSWNKDFPTSETKPI
jgi:hypothetical protein